jgi:FixJ family two-component response regulator
MNLSPADDAADVAYDRHKTFIFKNQQLVAIVDDDTRVLTALKRLLNALGFATKVFESGEQFLQSEEARDATCVVFDIHLGGMSGIEARRALSLSNSKIPVIFMTGCDTSAVRREAMDAGAYLHKPFKGQELIDAIRHAISAIPFRRQIQTADVSACRPLINCR